MNIIKCEVLVMNLRDFFKCLFKNEKRFYFIVRKYIFRNFLKIFFEIILQVYVLVFKEKILIIELFVFVLVF